MRVVREAATPLPLPPGAHMLRKPLRMDVGGWQPQTVDSKLHSVRYDLRNARDRVARLERSMEVLGRSAAHHRTEEAVA